MDKDLMDLWGNFFINAAKSQKQMEEMAEWGREAVNKFVDWSASFQKIYNLEAFTPAGNSHPREWNRGGDNTQKSLVGGLMKFWGVKNGPDEHLQLIRRYEELKERLIMQEETIRHLRLLLEDARRENLALMASRHRESNTEVEHQWNKTPAGYPT